MLPLLVGLIAGRILAILLHEGAHAITAYLVGLQPIIKFGWVVSSTTVRSAIHPWTRFVIQHSDWVCSCALAVVASQTSTLVDQSAQAIILAFWITALDAVSSDALGCVPFCVRKPPSSKGARESATFYCGNFGLLLLEATHSDKMRDILAKMIRITMMRGAQSAGIVTYQSQKKTLMVGKRFRVVNLKRTDLCELLLKKCGSALRAKNITAPQLFQGHTRFATSSIAQLPGCHPHRWSPPMHCKRWKLDMTCKWSVEDANLENFITHNGDLDAFRLHGVTYQLAEVQKLLAALLHVPCATTTDSLAIAGLLDVLNTAGVWTASVRYGYIYGALAHKGDLLGILDEFWSVRTLGAMSAVFEETWTALLKDVGEVVEQEGRTSMLVHAASEVLGEAGADWLFGLRSPKRGRRSWFDSSRHSPRASKDSGDDELKDETLFLGSPDRRAAALEDAMVTTMLERTGAESGDGTMI